MKEENNTEYTAWASLAYQDVLRPPPGRRTGWALLTTYSAELRGVAAALLALAGCERDNPSGTAVQLSGAVQQLRGKVHIAVQRGRLASPRGTRPGLSVLLDSFVHEVARDERNSSWHPKIALLRFDSLDESDAGPVWRFWIGSRNLTGSENLELGAVLEQASRGGAELTGLTDAIQWLAEQSGLVSRATQKMLRTLSEARWLLPDDWKQMALRLHGREGTGLPETPESVEELVIVSPFLDVTTIRTLSTWAGDGKRVLISNRDAFRTMVCLAPEVLAGWSLRALAQPNYPEEKEDTQPGVETVNARAVEQDETLGWSLHAKLIAVRRGRKGVQMWMGSANATARGWTGRNVECVLKLDARAEIWSGIAELCARAEPVQLDELQGDVELADDTEERLEAARKTLVAHWSVRLQHEDGFFRALSSQPLNVRDGEIRVRIGMLNRPMTSWPAGTCSIDLGEVPLAQQTHFIQVCLELGESSVCWLMRCPMDPELATARDAAAIAAALRPSELPKLWTAELRDLRSEEEGPDWDSVANGGESTSSAAVSEDRLTLEDILKCWGTREASEFEQIMDRWGGVLCQMRAQPQWGSDVDAERLDTLHRLSLKLIARAAQ